MRVGQLKLLLKDFKIFPLLLETVKNHLSWTDYLMWGSTQISVYSATIDRISHHSFEYSMFVVVATEFR